MCGICGKLEYDPDGRVDPDLLRRMLGSIAHRGPDGAGEHFSGPVALGHRRLAIIDLDTGAQPMTNEDNSVWVVFNGEIYNFAELRRDLVRRGHVFRSNSDTEVIVHLYEEHGDALVERLQGMFSFALWDERKRHLLLARDRVGIKPLYYVDTGRALIFASELKAILLDPSVERRIEFAAIDRFLTYYYVPGDTTPLAGVRKLEPGHFLTVDNGRIHIERYWDLEFRAPTGKPTLEQSAEALRELLDRTVRDHMISDVPVGVLLSGGVDSTGILHFASRHARQPLHSFTVGFDGAGFADERPYARLAAKAFGSRHHETTMSAGEFRDLLPLYVWHMEEPVCEPPALALYTVAKLARGSGIKVLLSGEGGDEAFAGYQDYRNLLALEALKDTFGSARGMLGLGFGALHSAGWQRGAHYRDLVGRQVADYYFSRTATPLTPFNRLKETLFGQAFDRGSGGKADDVTRRLIERVKDQPLLNRLLYVDTKSWLPDDLLVKADKMTMATSVELRVPLLDHHVLEFAASLPQRHKLRGWTLKRVLRSALQGAVPKEILKRRKAGFPVPYEAWMRNELNEFVCDTILAQSSFSSTYFSRPEVQSLIETHRRSGEGAKEVFSLLVLELWYQQFFRQPLTSRSAETPAYIDLPEVAA